MPTQSPEQAFERSISQLMQKRQHHASALAEIDTLFRRFGISINAPAANGVVARRGPGRPRKAAAGLPDAQNAVKKRGGRRTRGSFSQTAEELVLSLLPASTSEINKAWRGAGRGGTADNALTAMVKKKSIKRSPNKEGRGSTYSRA